MPRDPGTAPRHRTYLLRALPPLLLAVAGAVLLAVSDDSLAVTGIGLALLLFGAVFLASLFFYEVGRSEDRMRARERREEQPGRLRH
jgi:hypothetical protein